jgi:outer membrane protein
MESSAASLRTKLAQEKLTYKVKKAYFAVQAAEKSLKVAKDAESVFSEHAEKTKSLFEVGIISLDYLGAELRFSEAARDLKMREKDLKVLKANLNILLGRAPEEPIQLEEEQVYSPFPLSLNDVTEKALGNNPKVLLARTQAEIASARVNLANKSKEPQGKSKSGPNEKAENLLMSKIRLNRAVNNLSMADGELQQKVFSLYQDLTLAASKIEALDADLKISETYSDYLKNSFDAGAATSGDFCKAQDTYAKVQYDRIEALYDYNLAWAALERTVGEPILKKRAR